MNHSEISWKVIDKFFYDNENILVKHHIDSYNNFFSTGIQNIIAEKLKEQDKGKFKELKSLIKAKGQDKYAIATCDGFLIDGNRRKATMEELFREDGRTEFSMMKVIVLPDGKREGDGGAPTNQEIRTLERILQI